MSDGVALGLSVLLLLGNAFFVGSEFALISARRTQIEPRAREGSRAARVTLRALEQVSVMMAVSQLGITICSLGLGALAEPAIAHSIERPMEAIGAPEQLVHPVAFAIALTIVTAFHMILGEMVPKNIAIAVPDRAALVLGPALWAVAAVLRPVIWLTNGLANLVLRALKVEPKDEVTATFTKDEVASFVKESRREGLLDDGEQSLLEGALTLPEAGVAEVVLPLAQVRTVPDTITVADLEQFCADTGFSRFPVRGPDGGLGGYVHVKDMLGIAGEARREPLAGRWVRPLIRIRQDSTLRDALAAMQRRGAHVSLVVDAGGGVVGVAMLEDVIERLVGEVVDAGQQTRAPVRA